MVIDNNIMPGLSFVLRIFYFYENISMKKLVFFAVVTGILFITSCKKGTSNAGSWAFEGVSYNASSVGFSTIDNSLTAVSGTGTNTGSTLVFYFPYMPTVSGTYRVVNYVNVPLDSNQVYVKFVNSNDPYHYFSTGNDNVNAKVAVSPSGKISVTVLSVFIESYANPIPDSAQMTATITQQ